MDAKLLQDVYSCQVCPSGWFDNDERTGNNHKFPPTIGATGKVEVLFVGINPAKAKGDTLRDRKNRGLHRRSIRTLDTFELLARNRKPDNEGRDDGIYITVGGDEPFYEIHLKVLSAAFGNSRLEDHAAITELFLCASANSIPFYDLVPDSPCAHRFLDRTIASCDPDVIVPIGPQADRYFRPLGVEQLIYDVENCGRTRWVMPIPNPGHRGLSLGVRNKAAKETGRWIRTVLAGNDPDGVPRVVEGDLGDTWRMLAGEHPR